jgi:proline dehydrogenase
MLRGTLLYLSRQKQLRRWMEHSPAAARLTRRFVAGNTLERGLEVVQKLHAKRILTTLDRLGENVASAAEADASRDAYLFALESLAKLNLGATISVKLTQLGLDLSFDICRRNLETLAGQAKQLGSVVEVDMESSEYTDRTLDLVSRAHAAHKSVRAVIQAYLFRSESDIVHLNQRQIPVRLCKGAYLEPANVAFQRKPDVDANYLKLMKLLFENGACPAIATHDGRIVRRAMAIVAESRIQPECFEFQMLYGIRRDLQRMLVNAGHRLRLYVPYGSAWYPYFMRRLAERPANLVFLLKNLLRR